MSLHQQQRWPCGHHRPSCVFLHDIVCTCTNHRLEPGTGSWLVKIWGWGCLDVPALPSARWTEITQLAPATSSPSCTQPGQDPKLSPGLPAQPSPGNALSREVPKWSWSGSHLIKTLELCVETSTFHLHLCSKAVRRGKQRSSYIS